MISTPHHRLLLVGGLAAALLASAAISISVGTATIPLGEVWRTVLHPGGAPHATIIRDLRLPRTVLAIEVGVALGVAGALMQALTRNPLADPGLLGVNAGAALLVVIGITAFGVTTLTGYVWLAFVGAGGALAVVHAIGSRGAGAIPVRLALAGTALSAALTSVVIAIVLLDPAAFDTFRAWEVGSLTGRGAGVARDVAPFIGSGAAAAMLLARPLNALALGDDAGRALGAHVGRTRAVSFGVIALLSGAATAAAGPIAFVGLTIPHAARALVGPDHRWLLPCAMLLAPCLVLLADVVGRIADRPGEVQVGVVVALCGAPAFIMLVRQRQIGRR